MLRITLEISSARAAFWECVERNTRDYRSSNHEKPYVKYSQHITAHHDGTTTWTKKKEANQLRTHIHRGYTILVNVLKTDSGFFLRRKSGPSLRPFTVNNSHRDKTAKGDIVETPCVTIIVRLDLHYQHIITSLRWRLDSNAWGAQVTTNATSTQFVCHSTRRSCSIKTHARYVNTWRFGLSNAYFFMTKWSIQNST